MDDMDDFECDDFDKTLKVIVVGNGNVGKTSMTTRYAKGRYTGNYKKTIGVDFMEKRLELRDLGETVNLMIWDTAGQEEFGALTSRYYKGAGAVIYVFSTTDRASFDDLLKWQRKVEEECGRISQVLVQNKIDLIDDAAMSRREVEDMADDMRIRLFRSCVQDNVNVKEVFEHLCRQYLKFGSKGGRDEAVADISTLSEAATAAALKGSQPSPSYERRARGGREVSDKSDSSATVPEGRRAPSSPAASPTDRARDRGDRDRDRERNTGWGKDRHGTDDRDRKNRRDEYDDDTDDRRGDSGRDHRQRGWSRDADEGARGRIDRRIEGRQDRGRDRPRDRDQDRDRDRDRGSDRSRDGDHGSRTKDRSKDRGRDRDRWRDDRNGGGCERTRDGDKDRERRSRDHDRDEDRERRSDRGGDTGRDQERDRGGDTGRDRERDRDRVDTRGKDKEKQKERARERGRNHSDSDSEPTNRDVGDSDRTQNRKDRDRHDKRRPNHKKEKDSEIDRPKASALKGGDEPTKKEDSVRDTGRPTTSFRSGDPEIQERESRQNSRSMRESDLAPANDKKSTSRPNSAKVSEQDVKKPVDKATLRAQLREGQDSDSESEVGQCGQTGVGKTSTATSESSRIQPSKRRTNGKKTNPLLSKVSKLVYG